MVARDIARHPAHALRPEVAWMRSLDPSATRYFSAELSLQSILTAPLYRLSGESEALARLVVMAFSLAGIWWLYDVLARSAGAAAAVFGAFLYALLPYQVFFGRVFMPDIPAIALALGGLNYLDRWTGERRRGILIAAATLTGLAVLQKLTVIFVCLPLLYLFRQASRKAPVRRDLCLFASIAGLPALAWYAHSIAIAPLSSFTMERGLFARHLELWLQPGFLYQVARAAWTEAFSPGGPGDGAGRPALAGARPRAPAVPTLASGRRPPLGLHPDYISGQLLLPDATASRRSGAGRAAPGASRPAAGPAWLSRSCCSWHSRPPPFARRCRSTNSTAHRGIWALCSSV